MTEEFKKPPSREYLDEYYISEEGFSWGKKTIAGYREFASLRKFDIIVSLIKKINPEIILDVGCGGGLFVNKLKQEGYKIIGLDISYNLLSKIKDNKILISAKIQKIPFKDKTFDCILCSEVLEHIFDLDIAGREIKRVAKDNCKIIITVPNLHCYDALDAKFGIITKSIKIINFFRKIIKKSEIYKFGYNTHLNKNTPAGWGKIFTEFGFKIEYNIPIFISPYIPETFTILKKIENYIYSKKYIFNFQKIIEEKIKYLFPFNRLGQLHLFVCTK